MQDKTTGATLLDFVSYGPDPANPAQSLFRAVYGEIPAAAFTVAPSLHTARLVMTTPPAMYTVDCVIDIDGIYHCQYYTPFSFDLTWTKDGYFTSRGRRQLATTIGPVTTKSDEDGVTYSARMNGALPGVTAVNALGAVSETEAKTWTREFSINLAP